MPDYGKTFEDFVDSELEDGDRTYVSPWLGEEKTRSVLENDGYEEAIMSLEEGEVVRGFEDRERVRIVDSVDSYLESLHNEGFDAEFLAPPGKFADHIRENPEDARNLVKTWAEQSGRAVNQDGFTFYSNERWEDPRMAPFRKAEFDIDVSDLAMDTRYALADHFDRVEQIEGEDYSGVLASRTSVE